MLPEDSLHATLADIAARIALEAGDLIRGLRESGVDVAATKSSLTDVVTAADRAAELLVTERLREARPHDGVLGEEGAQVVGTSGITWVVDPIDGTVNYLYGLPAYAVSIAATVEESAANENEASSKSGLMADGRRAVAGAVYLPVTGEMFSTYLGGGARLNGEQVKASDEVDLSVALVGTGFGYTTERRTEQAEVVRRLIPRVRDIRRMGSAAIDLCMVAAGRLDGYYERGLQPWDYAAAVLVAREAGATVLAREDDQLPGEAMIIAGPPQLARALQSELKEAYRELSNAAG